MAINQLPILRYSFIRQSNVGCTTFFEVPTTSFLVEAILFCNRPPFSKWRPLFFFACLLHFRTKPLFLKWSPLFRACLLTSCSTFFYSVFFGGDHLKKSGTTLFVSPKSDHFLASSGSCGHRDFLSQRQGTVTKGGLRHLVSLFFFACSSSPIE